MRRRTDTTRSEVATLLRTGAILLVGTMLCGAWQAAAQVVPEPDDGEPSFTVHILADQGEVVDGQPITFRAVTDPPGFEEQVRWRAVTRCGFAEPAVGLGPEFTTVFFDTYCEPWECRWLVVRANEAEFKRQTEEDCIPDIFVPRGEDCWETDDCVTKASFCANPLPAGFFEPDSRLWRGEIKLRGPEEDDTIIDRKEDMFFPGWDIQRVKIQLAKLRLEGCHDITVEYEDGSEKSWSVTVEESDYQEEGDMEVTRQHDNGGFFDSTFPVYAKYTFTEVGNPDNEVVLDTGDPDSGRDPIELSTTGFNPWTSQLDPELGVRSCSESFTPGVNPGGLVEEPTKGVHTLGKRPKPKQCCTVSGHDGPGHLHVTKKVCNPCPPGACYNKKDLKCRVVNEAFCTGKDEKFQGMGTSCRDSDGDKLPDFVERNNCCIAGQVQQNTCLSLSSPLNADTDGDGISDGDEILQGRDPCTPGV